MLIEKRTFPPQQLPFSKKTKEWRKSNIEWADSMRLSSDAGLRSSLRRKIINYDLVAGKIHMDDIATTLNPSGIDAGFVPDTVQHMPIINSKLNVLLGEEYKRKSIPRIIVTNPDAISAKENDKKAALGASIQSWVEASFPDEESASAELARLEDYFKYEWQDIREVRANFLLNHYWKELNFPMIFNNGFMHGLTAGEEIYACDIVGGEPTIEALDTRSVDLIQMGSSNKIEDADMIIITDYCSPGKLTDIYYRDLTKEDCAKLYGDMLGASSDEMHNRDERETFVFVGEEGEAVQSSELLNGIHLFASGASHYYDASTDEYGNIRRLRFFWKSRRMVKLVTSFDPETGEEITEFYPETYKINKDLGESEKTFWINEAWEGVKLGDDIYPFIRPRKIQYNRLSNPSACHFGIVGRIYTQTNNRAYSLVEMMKPYNYMYNVLNDRLNEAIAANWGRILKLDLAMIPSGWDVEKWLYYAKKSKIAVTDSFKEGNYGAAKGKLSGMMNNNTNGVLDAETGSYIQNHINLMEFIKSEMGDVAGISRQREGQTSSRETVGGIERATLQSSHITEWLFSIHSDAKKAAIECFIETAKIAMMGESKKFQNILDDFSMNVINIDGDEFAECDYGLVYDESDSTAMHADRLNTLAQAAMQNQAVTFSTLIKIYSDTSMQSVSRRIENDEQKLNQMRQEEAKANRESSERIAQMQLAQVDKELALRDLINQRDNQTKLLIEKMKLEGEASLTDKERELLNEDKRQFDEKSKIEMNKIETKNTSSK